MANTDYKSTDGLMRHLRDNGIAISGSSQKQQLINTGYFHGYKGYRFFVSSSKKNTASSNLAFITLTFPAFMLLNSSPI